MKETKIGQASEHMWSRAQIDSIAAKQVLIILMDKLRPSAIPLTILNYLLSSEPRKMPRFFAIGS